MFDPEKITSIGAALLAGGITSLHCIGMCGPLASAFCPRDKCDSDGFLLSSVLYHASRTLSYGLIGALAGGIGRAPLDYFSSSPLHFFPWALVIFFLVIGLGLEQKFPRPLFITQWLFKIRAKMQRVPRYGVASAFGFLTPLLPCGPLYLVFLVALVSGSSLRGMEFCLAFAIGTIPLLWLAQHQIIHWSRKMPFLNFAVFRRTFALLAAFLVGWRLWNGSLNLPEHNTSPSCPMCHEKPTKHAP